MQNKKDQRNGDFYCFCENAYNQGGKVALNKILFPLTNQAECLSWYNDKKKIEIVTTFTPLIMGIVNVLVELLIGFASQFTRPLNETKNVIDSITGICFI